MFSFLLFPFCVVKVRLNNSFLHSGLLFSRIRVHKIFRFFPVSNRKKRRISIRGGVILPMWSAVVFYAKSIDLDSKYSLRGDFENSSQTRDSSKSSRFINNYSWFSLRPNKKEERNEAIIVCINSALFLFYGKSTYVCVLFNINLISASSPPPPPQVISGFAVVIMSCEATCWERPPLLFSFFSVRVKGETRVRVIAKLEAIRPRPTKMQSDIICSIRRSRKERKLGPTYNKRFPSQNWVQACMKRGGKKRKNNFFFSLS